jgi:hypothetical protein
MFIITATPVTTLKIAVELDEPAARAILVDPSSFQSELRARLAEAHNGQHGRRNIVIGKNARVPKGKAAARRAIKLFVKRPCRNCGRHIGLNQLSRHEAKCKTATAAAAA